MATLQLKFRSFADDVASGINVILQESSAYLSANNVTEAQAHALVNLAISDWSAYEWIAATLDGRVKGTAGADAMRCDFALINAAMANYYGAKAMVILSNLSICSKATDVTDILTMNNPGERDISLGFNVASGAAMLARCAELAQRAIINHRIALRLNGVDGISDVAQRADDFIKKTKAITETASTNASNPRPTAQKFDRAAALIHGKTRLATGTLRQNLNSKLAEKFKVSPSAMLPFTNENFPRIKAGKKKKTS